MYFLLYGKLLKGIQKPFIQCVNFTASCPMFGSNLKKKDHKISYFPETGDSSFPFTQLSVPGKPMPSKISVCMSASLDSL
jgi:hypothetical protein